MAVHSGFISFAAVGVQVVASGISAQVAIPVAASGALPKFVRIQSSGFCYIKFGASGVAATTNDFYLSANNAEIITLHGNAFMAYLQDTANAKITITPLEA